MKKIIALASSIVLGCLALSAAAAPPSATTRVSVSTAGGQGDRDSFVAAISADGRYVLLNSQATNLVSGDTNDRWDVFVHDRTTGATTRVSVTSGGAQARAGRDSFGGSTAGGISADGRYVVFQSDAPNLVDGDTNRAEDVFLRDRKGGRTTRISVGSRGRQANGSSRFPTISADGPTSRSSRWRRTSSPATPTASGMSSSAISRRGRRAASASTAAVRRPAATCPTVKGAPSPC